MSSKASGNYFDGLYSPRAWVEKKSMALRTFWAALGNAATAPCNIVTVGTSISEGYPPAGVPTALLTTQCWRNLLVTSLRKQFPTTATGTPGYYAAFHNIASPSDYPVVNTGGATNYNGGLGLRTYFLSGSGQKMIFTAPTATTSVDIIWWGSTLTGTFSWKHNSGGATNVTTTLGVDQDWNVTHISGVAAGDTIEVDFVSGICAIDGFFAYGGDETLGLRIYDSGQAAVVTETFIASATQRWFRAFNQLSPALVIIELGVNDANSDSSATFGTNLQTLISLIKAQCSPSIVLFMDWAIGTPVEPWQNYLNQMVTIAANDPTICVCDMYSVIAKGSVPATDTAGGMLPDFTHPNPAGSIIVADALFNFLRPHTGLTG